MDALEDLNVLEMPRRALVKALVESVDTTDDKTATALADALVAWANGEEAALINIKALESSPSTASYATLAVRAVARSIAYKMAAGKCQTLAEIELAVMRAIEAGKLAATDPDAYLLRVREALLKIA